MKNISRIISVIATLSLMFSLSCASEKGAPDGSGGGGEGKAGSMARFTIIGDFMYTVNSTTLKTINISDPEKPEYEEFRDSKLGFGIETIFPYNNRLFIGSRDAMYIYDVSENGYPKQVSYTQHFSSCDPVVAYGNYAYVTLNNANTMCQRGVNQLQIYDIEGIFDNENPTKPSVVKTRDMSAPKGLGIDGEANKLFVCIANGLVVLDVTDPENNLKELDRIGGIDTYDVIPMDGLLIVIGSDGLYQFDYTGDMLKRVSKIDLRK